jgi:hypothetical protein
MPGIFLVTHLTEVDDKSTATTHVFRDIASLHTWCTSVIDLSTQRTALPEFSQKCVEPPAAGPDAADAAPPLLLRAVFPGPPLYAVDDTSDRLHLLYQEDRNLLHEFQSSFVESALTSSDTPTAEDHVIAQAVYFARIRLWSAGEGADYASLFQKYTTVCLEDASCIPRGVSVRPTVMPDLQTLLRAHPLGPSPSNSEFAFYDRNTCRQAWERIAVAIYCDVQKNTIREQTLCDWMTWLLQTSNETVKDVTSADALARLEADIARLPPSLADPLKTACEYGAFRSGVVLQKVPVAVSSLRAANFEEHIGALLSTTA